MNINIHGPINNTGYGVATKNIIKGLISLEHKVDLHHIGGTAVDSPNDKDLFDGDRPKLLEFYSDVVSPWSRDGAGFEESSKEKYRDGLEKHAPWLGITRNDSPSLNTASTSKLMSGTDVRHYLREFHKQIVDLYGAAINNTEEGSQERQDLLVEFQGILEETKGVQANYIVNVLNIPEFDYLKDRTQEGGDNKTLGGYLNESILRKLIREYIRKHVRKEKI